MDPKEMARAEAIIHAFIEEQGFEIYALKISADRHVNLTVDLDPGPVQMNHVVKLNYGTRDALGEGGLDQDAYAVDVQSPGVRRDLKKRRDFERFEGERARLKVGADREVPPEIVVGILGRAGEDGLHFEPEEGPARDFSWDEIRYARLDPSY